MAIADEPQRRCRGTPTATARTETEAGVSWSRGDTYWAIAWMLAGLAARAPLAARIEGLLDHDQGVVGLMALDIAEGRRLPIFFDGQRYMGALEAYIAAAFVATFGHSPAVVAMAPTLSFGLFAAGQYALWRLWAGRATGHLAALLAAVGSPMLALWGLAPRGGYSELLAWAPPTLAAYRVVVRPGGGPRSRLGQAGWGFLLVFGYFLNPLSLIVYATLALDWTLGRHGADLRRERGLSGGWVESPRAPWIWATFGGLALVALAAACHVELERRVGTMRYVYALDAPPGWAGAPLGLLGVALVMGGAAWWTGAARRLLGLLASHPWFGLGVLAALAPFVAYNLRVALGGAPRDPSLPIWIVAPWAIGPNLRDGLHALRPLVGCDAHAAALSIAGLHLEVPPPTWPTLARRLSAATPAVIAVVAALLATVARRDRRAWCDLWALRGRGPTPPTVLALTGLAATFGLYLLQSTNADSTSIRYLLPSWIFLPGLLACGLRAWPRPARVAAAALLLTSWTAAQAQLRADMGRPSPLRAVAEELGRRGVSAVVAPTPILLLIADLTQGRVAGLEYQSYWPRMGDRYADRFAPGRSIVCVNDLEYGRPLPEIIGLRLRELARSHPGQVRLTWQQGRYEIWEADVPMTELLDPGQEDCQVQETEGKTGQRSR